MIHKIDISVLENLKTNKTTIEHIKRGDGGMVQDKNEMNAIFQLFRLRDKLHKEHTNDGFVYDFPEVFRKVYITSAFKCVFPIEFGDC